MERIEQQNGTFKKRKRPKSKGILLLEENLARHLRLTLWDFVGKESRKGSYNICPDNIHGYNIITCLDLVFLN